MMRINKIFNAAVIAAAFLSAFPAAAMPTDYHASATLDSTTLVQGGKTTLKVDFSGPMQSNAAIEIGESDNPELEITSEPDKHKVNDLGNGRKQLQQEYTVQVFDSGLYVMPKIYCISGTDTIIPQSPALKVEPVALDSVNLIIENGEVTGVTVHDYTDISSIEDNFWDFLPDAVQKHWWKVLIALVVLGLLIFSYFKWFRYGKMPLRPQKKQIPPYVLAVRQLDALREKKLWQKGADKEYYTRLTDILRIYLFGRFGINAMEMTSEQIREAIAHCDMISDEAALVNDVLSEADFVKFAKARPSADVNERTFNDVRQFVEITKPVEQPENNEKSDGKADNNAPKSAPASAPSDETAPAKDLNKEKE